MKVLIPQDVNEAGKAYLRDKGYGVVVGSGFDKETIKREIVDCDALLARTAQYPAEVIAQGKKLQVIARYGVGTDNIDTKFAEEQGVWVTIAKGANVNAVAEHTVALILACSKNLIYCDRQTKAGDWEVRNRLPTAEISGKTVGIIGLGAIGQGVAAILHNGFHMEIIGYDAFLPPNIPEYIKVVNSTDDIFTRSDVVTLHVPSTPETQNMVNSKTLSMMKPSAYLINCARGGIVNEEDLFHALKDRTISVAAMDVFQNEPPEEGNKLLTLDNYIASPHNAGLSGESGKEMSLSCARAIDDVLSGRKPQFPVNDPRK